jgi:hypothetical protein
MRQPKLARCICTALAAGLAFSAQAATVTFTNAPGSSAAGSIGPLSDPETDGAFGETFDFGGKLDSLTFYGGGPVTSFLGNLELVIEAWDGTRPVGPALYVSGPVAYATETTFSGINTSLATGSYVALLTSVGVSNPVDRATFAISTTNGGFVGPMVYVSPGVDPFASDSTWNTLLGPTPYLEFQATVEPAPVPLPASLWLMICGAASFGAARRLRLRPWNPRPDSAA